MRGSSLGGAPPAGEGAPAGKCGAFSLYSSRFPFTTASNFDLILKKKRVRDNFCSKQRLRHLHNTVGEVSTLKRGAH